MLSAWRRQSSSSLVGAFSNALQRRWLGYANVWIDEATAAERRKLPHPKPFRRKSSRRDEFESSRHPRGRECKLGKNIQRRKPKFYSRDRFENLRKLAKENVPEQEYARKGIKVVGKTSDIDAQVDGLVKESTKITKPQVLDYKPHKQPKIIGYWKDGTPRLAGREGRLHILETGRIQGEHRAMYISKYGRPKRIRKKARLAKVERGKIYQELFDSEGNPTDFGAVRRLREKRMDKQRLNSRMKRRDRNFLATTSEDSSSPFMVKPDETRKVKTMFGEFDVTRVRMLREYKKSLKQVEASERGLEITDGVKKSKTSKVKSLTASDDGKMFAGGMFAEDVETTAVVVSGNRKMPKTQGMRFKQEETEFKDVKRADTRKVFGQEGTNRLIGLKEVPKADTTFKKQVSDTGNFQKVKTLTLGADRKTTSPKEEVASRLTSGKNLVSETQATSRKEEAASRLTSARKLISETSEVSSRLTPGKNLVSETQTASRKDEVASGKNISTTQTTSRNEDVASRPSSGKKLVFRKEEAASGKNLTQTTTRNDEVASRSSSGKKLVSEAQTTSRKDGLASSKKLVSDGQTSSEKQRKTGTDKHWEVPEIASLQSDVEDEDDDVKWVLPSKTESGDQIARLLGTDKLLDFPRLMKVKKSKPEPKAKPYEDYTVLSAFQQTPSPFKEFEPETSPAIREPENLLEEIKRRNFEIREALEDKARRDYEAILRLDLATFVKKPRVNKRLVMDPSDTTNKRIDDNPTKPGPPKEPGTNAKFRMIQPPYHLMNYLDTQMLGRRRLDEWRKAGYNLKLYAPLDNVPFTKGDERHKIQQSVFRNRHLFVAAAKTLSSIPPAELPEIAFAGRSNAGKSKLINALTRHWGTARTSPRPGTTNSINFYVLGQELCMVDLPGYSFMYGKEEKISELKQLTKDYITIRDELKRVCVLVDAQWGFKHTDREFIEFLESVNQKYQLVLTKADKVSPRDLARRATQAEELLKDAKCHVRPLLMVSSRHGAGLGRLRMSLTSVLDP